MTVAEFERRVTGREIGEWQALSLLRAEEAEQRAREERREARRQARGQRA